MLKTLSVVLIGSLHRMVDGASCKNNSIPPRHD